MEDKTFGVVGEEDLIKMRKKEFLKWVKEMINREDDIPSHMYSQLKQAALEKYKPKIKFVNQPWDKSYDELVVKPNKKFIEFLKDYKLISFMIDEGISQLDYDFLPPHCNIELVLWQGSKWKEAIAEPKFLTSFHKQRIKPRTSKISLSEHKEKLSAEKFSSIAKREDKLRKKQERKFNVCLEEKRKRIFIHFNFQGGESHAVLAVYHTEEKVLDYYDTSMRSIEWEKPKKPKQTELPYYVERLIMQKSVKKYIKELTGEKIKVNFLYLSESCPRYMDIQGQMGTCLAWTSYFLCLTVLNPFISRDDLIGLYRELGEKERNKYLFIYLFFLYDSGKIEVEMEEEDYDWDDSPLFPLFSEENHNIKKYLYQV